MIGVPGRPKFNITYEQLQFLLDIQFTIPEMAQILGVSPRTVARRMSSLNLSVRSRYLHLSDDQLDRTIRTVQQAHPNYGYRMMKSLLSTHKINIQEQRIRRSMKRADPLGVAYRWARSIHRRKYSVPYPNALWHIDSYHALIRWKLIIHGGIDGYSRLIVYLKCSSNNRSDTVFGCFMEACSDVGVPSRVRSDRGGENVSVATFMAMYRGIGRGSHLTGTSVHNQRIERLWRDVYTACINLYYHLFYLMEDCGILHVENEIELYSLHYVYVPRINRHLTEFRESWNCHPLTSSHCRSPLQLWVRGMFGNVNSGHTAMDDFLLQNVNLDTWLSLFPSIESDSVEVESVHIPISDEDAEHLQSMVQPLQHSNCWGVDIYFQAVSYLEDISS